jgi:hypothetical protein
LPLVAFIIVLGVAFMAFSVDVMRTAYASSAVRYGAEAAALGAFSASLIRLSKSLAVVKLKPISDKQSVRLLEQSIIFPGIELLMGLIRALKDWLQPRALLNLMPVILLSLIILILPIVVITSCKCAVGATTAMPSSSSSYP